MLSRSVVERRLEFATLKAIGIPGRTILMVVAAEAVLVSFVASLIGIGVSLFFGLLINATIAVQYGFESLYSADVVSFLVVFLLALGLGVIAGLAPARRATRVDPVDILREA
jgi:putative ABC transport system permease protein